MLGPIPWLLDTSGPEGGKGIGLRSGTELLSPPEQAEEVGVADTEVWLLRAFSVSVLCLALTIPTGIVPATQPGSLRAGADWERNNTCSGGQTLSGAGAAHRFIKAGGRDFSILNSFQVPAGR